MRISPFPVSLAVIQRLERMRAARNRARAIRDAHQKFVLGQ